MPVKYVTANDGQLVVERWVGAISHAELTSHGKRQHEDAAIAPGAVVPSPRIATKQVASLTPAPEGQRPRFVPRRLTPAKADALAGRQRRTNAFSISTMNNTEAATSTMRSQIPVSMAAVPNSVCIGGR